MKLILIVEDKQEELEKAKSIMSTRFPEYRVLVASDLESFKRLFEAMKNVLEDKIAFENSEVIRSYVVDNFSKQKIAEQFSEIYNKVLTK